MCYSTVLIEMLEYLDDRERSPFALWRATLDPTTRARIEISLARLGSGNLSGVKNVGSGISELRLDFGPGYRIYLAQQGESFILLLGGGTKRRQQDDIAAAQSRWQDYKRRKVKKT